MLDEFFVRLINLSGADCNKYIHIVCVSLSSNKGLTGIVNRLESKVLV